jgi:anti-repressor protein
MTELEHNQFPLVVEGMIGATATQTVDARDLYRYLRVGKDFSTWIKDRVEQYTFTENTDFIAFEAAPQNGGAGNRGARREYAISIDMAKELAMVERNDQGKRARQYFIECERKARAGVTAADLLANPGQLLAIAQGYALQIEDMRRDMSVMKSDSDALTRIAGDDSLFGIRRTAKILQVPQNRFVEWLKQNNWAYRQLGTSTLLAYADKEKVGYCRNVGTPYEKSDGSQGIRDTLKFFPKGIVRLAKIFNVTLVDGDLRAHDGEDA